MESSKESKLAGKQTHRIMKQQKMDSTSSSGSNAKVGATEKLKDQATTMGMVQVYKSVADVLREHLDNLRVVKENIEFDIVTLPTSASPTLADKIKREKIPWVEEEQKVDFLMYKLGDPAFDARAEILLMRQKIMYQVLFAPSGSGKTRLGFEVITRLGMEVVAIFLTMPQVSGKNSGSLALDAIIKVCIEYMKSRSDIYDWDNASPSRGVYDARTSCVMYAVKCVLFAYLCVLDKVQDRTSKEKLLLQIYPKMFFGSDVFRNLALSLFLKCRREEVIGAMLDHHTSMKAKFLLLDEANMLSIMHGKFLSKSGECTRSILSPILEELTNFEPHTVISGTGLSLLTAAEDPGPKFAESGEDVYYKDFPLFSESETRAFLSGLLKDGSNDTIIDEAAKWLCGRPRFAIEFARIALIALQADKAPMDSTAWSALLKQHVDYHTKTGSGSGGRTAYDLICKLNFGAHQESNAQFVEHKFTQLFVQVINYSFLLEYGEATVPTQSKELVELGLAYRMSERNTELRYEPLMQEAARMLRIEKYPNFAIAHMNAVFDSAPELGRRFERIFAAFFLPKLLKKQFSVPHMPEIFGGEWELPGPRYGRMAEVGGNGNAFYDWLEVALDVATWNSHNPPYGIMFPDSFAGPDVVAVLLQRDGGKVSKLALFAAQLKFVDKPVDGIEALRTADPSYFYHIRRGGSSSLADAIEAFKKATNELVERLLGAMNSTTFPEAVAKSVEEHVALVKELEGKVANAFNGGDKTLTASKIDWHKAVKNFAEEQVNLTQLLNAPSLADAGKKYREKQKESVVSFENALRVPRAIEAYEAKQKFLVEKGLEQVPVIRALISGAWPVAKAESCVLPRSRPNQKYADLQIVLDDVAEIDPVLGGYLKDLKSRKEKEKL